MYISSVFVIHSLLRIIIYNYWLQWGRHKDLSTWKSDILRGRKAEVNITLKGRWILMSTVIEVNNLWLFNYEWKSPTFTFVLA